MITDFRGSEGDILDVSHMLAGQTSFAGNTAQQAIQQGYIYWVQNGWGANVSITVYVDPNGGSHSPNLHPALGQPDFAIATLEGVRAGALNASHFDVIV